MSDLDKINSIFNAKIDSVKTKIDLQNIKTEFFGKNGQITQQFKKLGSMDQNKRNLILINSEKAKKDLKNTENLFETLMGKQADLRFKFIQNNANFIDSVDV